MKKGVVIIIFLAVVGYLAREKIGEWLPIGRSFEKQPPASQAVPETEIIARFPKAGEPVSGQTPPAKASESSASTATDASQPELYTPPKETLDEINEMLKSGNKMEAWGKLTRKLLSAASDAERDAVKSALTKLNKEMFFSRDSAEGAEFYVAQEGDSLHAIGQKFGAAFGLIKWASNKSSDTVRVGERLKIPAGRVKLLVDKSDFRIYVLLNNCYLKDYPVGIGKDNRTPVGTFVIKEKLVNPPWYAPDGKIYAFGDEKNILGTRWMAFEETAKYRGYGIHGTTMPERVSKAESNGCICMYNADVQDLFDAVGRGTEVVIRE